MFLTLKDALPLLAKITGNDETMIKDNANYPITIYAEMDNIDPSEDHISNYVVNDDGIFKIGEDGFIEQMPIYKVI